VKVIKKQDNIPMKYKEIAYYIIPKKNSIYD